MGSPQFVLRRSHLPYLLAVLFMLLVGLWSARTGLIPEGVAGDGMQQYMPGRAFSADILKSGSLPEWNPYIYTGFPQIGDIQNGFFYPPNLIFYLLLSAPAAYTVSIAFNVFLTAFFTSQFLKLFVRSKHAVWIGAATFALCGFLACNAVTVTIPDSAAWVPAFFWCVEKWMRTERWRYCAWGGVCLAMELFAGWPQMVLLSVIYLGVYLIFALPRQSRRVRIVAGLAVAGVIAAGIGIPQLVATLQLKEQSTIQHLAVSDFVFSSVAPQLSLLLFFPFLIGSAYASVLWHKVYYYGPISVQVNAYYVGLMPLMLAVAALWYWRRSRYVRFGASAAVLSLLLAWGGYTPLWQVLYRIPVYNFFHDHRINLVFFAFAVGVLAACAADRISFPELNQRHRERMGWMVPAIVTGVAVLLLLHVKSLFRSMSPNVGAMAPGWPLQLHRVMRLDSPDMMLPIALLFFCAWLFWFWMRHPQSRRLATFVVALVIADLLYFGVTSMWTSIKATPGPGEQAAMAAMQSNADGQQFRSIALDWFPGINPNLNAIYDHSEVLGLGPFLPKRHTGLLNSLNVGRVAYWRELMLNNTVLSMLNTRYIEVRGPHLAEIEQALGPVAPSLQISSPTVALTVGENLLAKPEWSTNTGQKLIPPPTVIPPCTQKECPNAGIMLQLDPNSAYELSFQAQVADPRPAPGRPGDSSGYGGGFAGTADPNYFEVSAWMLSGSSAFSPCTRLYFTGADTKGLFFILWNSSRTPLELKDLSLRKLGSFPLGHNLYRLVGKFGGMDLLENPLVYPRAFFVSRLQAGVSFAEARSALWQTAQPFDARHIALVEAPANELPASVSEGTVHSLKFLPKKVQAGVSCPGTCYLVLSDMYYPGWHATIDGKETPIYLTDAMVRGIVVPAGDHQIEFSYHSRSLRLAILISLLSFGIVLLITIRSHGSQ